MSSILVFCMLTACENPGYVAHDDYIPLDDREQAYTGLPRVVIETERRQQIWDREKEVPAKLQVWGERAPQSEVFEATIRGRGNSTWQYPKKPYAIKFSQKHSLLEMAPAKKWVMLANFRDRTLIRNAVALEISRRMGMEWTPSGIFTDVYLNGKFIGNYYVTEKIQISKNRLNLRDNAVLLEQDIKYDGKQKFKTKYFKLPVNVKDPDQVDSTVLKQIKADLDSTECILLQKCAGQLQSLIDFESFAKAWIIYELAQNDEPNHPKSLYMYREPGEPFKAGPVWDFDWKTFVESSRNTYLNQGLWIGHLIKNRDFVETVRNTWNAHRDAISDMDSHIDSLASYTRMSNEANSKRWPLKLRDHSLVGDETLSQEQAIEMLKNSYRSRVQKLDGIFNNL